MMRQCCLPVGMLMEIRVAGAFSTTFWALPMQMKMQLPQVAPD